jgi:hypothetical protein
MNTKQKFDYIAATEPPWMVVLTPDCDTEPEATQIDGGSAHYADRNGVRVWFLHANDKIAVADMIRSLNVYKTSGFRPVLLDEARVVLGEGEVSLREFARLAALQQTATDLTTLNPHVFKQEICSTEKELDELGVADAADEVLESVPKMDG